MESYNYLYSILPNSTQDKAAFQKSELHSLPRSIYTQAFWNILLVELPLFANVLNLPQRQFVTQTGRVTSQELTNVSVFLSDISQNTKMKECEEKVLEIKNLLFVYIPYLQSFYTYVMKQL